MIKYDQLYHFNLKALEQAAKAWGDMATKLKSLDGTVPEELEKPFAGACWASSDGTSQKAAKQVKDCRWPVYLSSGQGCGLGFSAGLSGRGGRSLSVSDQ